MTSHVTSHTTKSHGQSRDQDSRGRVPTTANVRRCSPEQTLPRGEVGSLEEGVFEDALNSTQCLDHVHPVVIEIPQLAIMTLVGPPEWVLLEHLATAM